MESPLEGDHGRASGVQSRELDRVLDRLRARVEERGTGLGGDRDERAEALRELDVRLVGDDGVVRVDEPLGLVDDRVDDPRMCVTGVDDADTAGEVDEDVAVDVRDRRVLGGRGEDRQVRVQRCSDRPCLTLEKASRLRAGHLGLDPDRPRDRHGRPAYRRPPLVDSVRGRLAREPR